VKLFKRQHISEVSMAAKSKMGGDLDPYGGECGVGNAISLLLSNNDITVVCMEYGMGIVDATLVLACDRNLLCACSETPAVSHLSHLEVGTL
jgi:hypothetical protein